MKNSLNSVGTHIIGELFDCSAEMLKYRDSVEKVLRDSVQKANFNALHYYFYQFEPVGVTGVVVLSQSHISIHTWPEHNYLAVDVFSCGSSRQAEKAFDSIVKAFGCKNFRKRINIRGVAEELVENPAAAFGAGKN